MDAVEWLLASDEPAIRALARRDLLGEDAADDAARTLDGQKARALLAGQREDGGFGVHRYGKWGGAHWRLVSLVELGAPPREARLVAAAETVLEWLTGRGHRRGVVTIAGRVRRCASQEGNALAVCSRLGLADDERVELLARSLVEWQWPDGGWNCDRNPGAWRSSFHETLAPVWGLHEYAAATGARWARDAAARGAELFLEHRVFRTRASGEPIDPGFVQLHYPPYWHYDVLQCLLVLARIGKVRDERAADAIALLQELRRDDGRWQPGGHWWRRPGSKGSNVEVVDWGRRGPNEMLTLNALRVLRAAGVTAAAERRPSRRLAA